MAPPEDAVKPKVQSVGGDLSSLLTNGAPNDSFNSRISTDFVPGDFDMAESHVAVAGSVDSTFEAPVADTVSASVDTGPASSSDVVVDATEKVESWDLSEAGANEGASNKEDSKALFSDEGALENVHTEDDVVVSGVSSDLIPTSAASMEDAARGEPLFIPSAEVEDKSVEVDSGDAEIAASEDVSPKIQNEGTTEEGDSEEAPEPTVEEVHEVAEATTTSAEPDEEVASPEALPPPSADVEEKSVDVEDKSVDVEDKSVEVDSGDAGGVSEIAASEDVNPKIQNEGIAEEGDSEAPEPTVEEVHEVAEATTSAEPDEQVASLEALPPPSADVEDKTVDVEDKSVDVEDKSVEVDSGGAGGLSEIAASEDASPKIQNEGANEDGDSEAPEPTVEEVHEVAEATTTAESDEQVASPEALPPPSADVEEKSVDVEDKSVEVGSEDVGVVSEVGSPKIPDEGSAEKGDSEVPEPPVEEVDEVPEAANKVEPDEEVASLEAVPSPSADVEDKSVKVNSEDAGGVSEVLPAEIVASEDVSPKIPDEGSAGKGDSEAPEPPVEAVDEVPEVTTSVEPDEEVASPEAVPSPSAVVEDKSVEVNSEDAGGVSEVSASVDVSPKIPDGGSAEKGDNSEAPEPSVEEVHEDAEATTSAEPDEEVASLPPPSADFEDKSVEVNSESVGFVGERKSPKIPDEGSAERGDSEAPEPPVEEIPEATTSAEPEEEVASPEAVSSPSAADVEDKSVEVNSEDVSEVPKILPSYSADNEGETSEILAESHDAPVDHVEPTTSAEAHEESVPLLESVPALADDVEDKSVEVDSEDASEASKVLPSESADDKEVISPKLPAEGSPDNVGTETLYVPNEEVHEVVEATISAEPNEEFVEPESGFAAPDVVEDKSVPSDVVEDKSAPSDVEDKSLDVNSEESGVDEGSASLESVSSPATNVEDKSVEVNPEPTSEAKVELPSESADNEDVSPELPPEGSAENFTSEALFTPVEEVHEVVEATISAESNEVSTTSSESGPALDDVEEAPVEEKSEDLNEATTHAPIEDIGKVEGAATDAESAIPESVAASSEDAQSMPETASREFNFNDPLTTSDDVPSGKVTIGDEGSSSHAVASDAIVPQEASSSPRTAVDKKETRRSYDLHQVAINLEDAAEKTLEDAKSRTVKDRQASVAESVAQIVLEESGKTEDSSELISGVIQHVAQLAQDDFQSDPNVLPDTVNQVFDRASSPANEASQPKESTSLGTKFSLFVIWCISLCASHVSSKAMPAPTLKLAAEEVAAVLHSNAQEPASSKPASSKAASLKAARSV